MKKKAKEVCENCGQTIDKEVFLNHLVARLKLNGLPNFAMLLKTIKDFER